MTVDEIMTALAERYTIVTVPDGRRRSVGAAEYVTDGYMMIVHGDVEALRENYQLSMMLDRRVIDGRTIDVSKCHMQTRPCGMCDGTGLLAACRALHHCATCGQSIECNRCQEGWITGEGDPCEECDGTGSIPEPRVTIDGIALRGCHVQLLQALPGLGLLHVGGPDDVAWATWNGGMVLMTVMK